MPEGPSLVILKEAVQAFKGKKIISTVGNSKQFDIHKLDGQVITDFKSWGKHFLICFKKFTVRIHFMLFGSYRINEDKNTVPRLGLQFKQGQINFYACSVRFIEEDINEIYDWTADVMNPAWDPKKAKTKLRNKKDLLVCDALLDQDIFAGVGNIIKNEVLFRIKVHPGSMVSKLPPAKLNALIKEAVVYSFDFLKWKKEFVLKKHWLAHTKKICPRDNTPFDKKYLGKTKRRSFFCSKCQRLYT
ncbi:MAG TPA: DNA-formamidopyrimidine glycosylase family protein [Ferruginibacter sp.]|nr:DNA-formamidopyrimidine glycosylase family protein [Ferruginibacter sp.]